MKSIVAFGHIDGGTLKIHHRRDFDLEIAKFKGDCCITVEIGSKRSIEFNAYWWGMCRYVGKQLGWSEEEVHEHTKLMCNYKIVFLTNKKTGETQEMKVAQPTRNLTTTRMMELKESAFQYWSEQGIPIPDEYWRSE